MWLFFGISAIIFTGFNLIYSFKKGRLDGYHANHEQGSVGMCRNIDFIKLCFALWREITTSLSAYRQCTKTKRMNMLEPGMKVPDFTLHDANGNAVSLHDRASKTVVYRSIPRAVFMYDREATTQNKNSVPYYSVSKWSSNTKMLLLHFHTLLE